MYDPLQCVAQEKGPSDLGVREVEELDNITHLTSAANMVISSSETIYLFNLPYNLETCLLLIKCKERGECKGRNHINDVLFTSSLSHLKFPLCAE